MSNSGGDRGRNWGRGGRGARAQGHGQAQPRSDRWGTKGKIPKTTERYGRPSEKGGVAWRTTELNQSVAHDYSRTNHEIMSSTAMKFPGQEVLKDNQYPSISGFGDSFTDGPDIGITAGGFIPDVLGETDAVDRVPIGGFVPDTLEGSDNRSWADRRKAEMDRSRGSLDIEISDREEWLSDTDGDAINDDWGVGTAFDSMDISPLTEIPDTYPIDVGAPGAELPWHIKYSEMPDLSYWTVHFQFPAIHHKTGHHSKSPPPKKPTTTNAHASSTTQNSRFRSATISSPPNSRYPQSSTSTGTTANRFSFPALDPVGQDISESVTVSDYKRLVKALEAAHVHLDPPEMSFFKMSTRSKMEIDRLLGSESKQATRTLAGSGTGDSRSVVPPQHPPTPAWSSVPTLTSSVTSTISPERVSRVIRMATNRGEGIVKQHLLPLFVPHIGQQSLATGLETVMFPLLAEGIDIKWVRIPSLFISDFRTQIAASIPSLSLATTALATSAVGGVPSPQPSYTLGFDRLAFPPHLLAKLIHLERSGFMTGSCTSPTSPASTIFFPFFCAEPSVWPWTLKNRADARSAYQMAHAGQMICTLFEKAGKIEELYGQVLGFSVQISDDGQSSICAHYPIIMSSGAEPEFCRKRIKEFGTEKGGVVAVSMVNRFVERLEKEWAPKLLGRILDALKSVKVDEYGDEGGGGDNTVKEDRPNVRLTRALVESWD